MMQHCPQTLLSEGFQSLGRNYLHSKMRQNFKLSVYCDLEFLNWWSLIILGVVWTEIYLMPSQMYSVVTMEFGGRVTYTTAAFWWQICYRTLLLEELMSREICSLQGFWQT